MEIFACFVLDLNEEVVEVIDAIVLTDTKALHLRALTTFVDAYGKVSYSVCVCVCVCCRSVFVRYVVCLCFEKVIILFNENMVFFYCLVYASYQVSVYFLVFVIILRCMMLCI